MDLKNLYDEFQAEAVGCIKRDFTEHSNGRFLLVIPTGGGKTFTCIKGIAELFKSGKLKLGEDKVLWVAHRVELLNQAEATFKKVGNTFGLTGFWESFYLESNTTAEETLKSFRENIKLIVIDEAHRAAANTYIRLFEYHDKPVLGLTATPARHDGQALPFERETYSIGFPDLIDKGILIKPKIISEEGISLDIDDFSDSSLDKLNNSQRNSTIINTIINNHDEFKKVVVFLGTKKHVKEFYELLISSPVNELYSGNISYITGDGNSYGQDRKTYIDSQKALDRSIIVNVDVLTEGYDDPKINTAIIARPTRSKLFYMQAAGRAIRRDPDNASKKSYIVEIEDSLPNIKYRMDNRWLYAEISDWLEPVVKDYCYTDHKSLIELEKSLIQEFACEDLSLQSTQKKENGDFEFALFKRFLGGGKFAHTYLPLSGKYRRAYLSFFNSLSEKLMTPKLKGKNSEALMAPLKESFVGALANKETRKIIYEAMANSSTEDNVYKQHAPWITYITIQKSEPKEDNMAKDITEIEVELKHLVLDPNNPRFITEDIEKVPLIESHYPDIQKKAMDAMCAIVPNQENFDIPGLIDSIIENGYRPLDRIFVRTIPGTDFYLVLEGNRRVTALKSIKQKKDDDPSFKNKSAEDIKSLKNNIKKIKVGLLSPNLSEDEIQSKISTILGLRHHGSLKMWSPFAQARNIYSIYMEHLGENVEFRWDDSIGSIVAQTLSIKLKDVKERIRVYRGMKQLQDGLEFTDGAQIEHKYYSLVSELVNSGRKGLSQHIVFTPDTFSFQGDAIIRLNKLCFFSCPNRYKDKQPAPINQPNEWRPYNNILLDEDSEKRSVNIGRVEERGEKPSDIWAERAEELNKLEWSRFFDRADVILSGVNFGSLFGMPEDEKKKAITIVKELSVTLEELK